MLMVQMIIVIVRVNLILLNEDLTLTRIGASELHSGGAQRG